MHPTTEQFANYLENLATGFEGEGHFYREMVIHSDEQIVLENLRYLYACGLEKAKRLRAQAQQIRDAENLTV